MTITSEIQRNQHYLYSFNSMEICARHCCSILDLISNCLLCLKNNIPVWLCLCVCHLCVSVIVLLHVCSTPECTFQRQDSSWACWTFACYQELRVKWRELIFCLLEVHSLGLGRSLAHSLGCHVEGSLSHPTPHYHHPLNPPLVHSLTPSLFLSLHDGCLSSSWHLSCRYWERCALSCWHQDWSSSFSP